jgi:SsrA-binding protein
MAKEETNPGTKLLADNRKARFNYSVEDKIECGIALHGTEVKSLKSGRFSFSDAYGRIKDDELWLVGFHISPYPFGNMYNHDPDRDRKLLAHKQEIKRLKRKTDERGYTLVPLKFYLKRGMVKLELGVCLGKKLYDKRETIKKRDQQRDAQREMRNIR